MASDGLQPKAVYEPVAKLEAFYTGGAVRVTRDNKHMACPCGDEVKLLDLATGTVTRTLPGVSDDATAAVAAVALIAQILQQSQQEQERGAAVKSTGSVIHQ